MTESPTFTDLGLGESLMQAIADLGFSTPTPIQRDAIPLVLAGRDLLGGAPTGTGKTAAYGLPLLKRLLPDAKKDLRLVVIVPTRELADQVHHHLEALAAHTPLRGFVATGGRDMVAEEHQFRTGADWVVATPGRLLAHLKKIYVPADAVRAIVLDEADELLELGFLPDVKEIVQSFPAAAQTLLFSATLPKEMESFAAAILKDPVRVEVSADDQTAPLREKLWPVASEQKYELLRELLRRREIDQALIFCRTKRRTEKLYEFLLRVDERTELLHGDRSMSERIETMQRFREGSVPILVATDIAARGLDIGGISHVINFDVPLAPEDYVHRVGRTARAGAAGTAITLMAKKEETAVAKIEHFIRHRFAPERFEDFDYLPDTAGESTGSVPQRRHIPMNTRKGSKKKKESPFTKSGRAKAKYAVPDPEKEKSKRKPFKIKKRLPHER